MPLLKDVKSQAPQAVCELDADQRQHQPASSTATAPPFDNPEMRRAMALALDRKAFIDILTEGQGDIGGAMLPPPGGLWGMPPEMLETLPGYDPDVEKNRAEARKIMEKLGYGPDKRLAVKVVDPQHPDLPRPGGDPDRPAEGDLYRRRARRRSRPPTGSRRSRARTTRSALNLTGNGVDDPDQQFYENYACGSERNYTGYCNPEIDKLIDQQSVGDRLRRSARSWSGRSTSKLQEDGARPIIFYTARRTCWQP